MSTPKTVLAALTICVFSGALATSAGADQWNKKTKLTFSQPVEIPGRVLTAGTYTFKLYDSLSNRNIVQIWNEDETRVISTILAISDYRLTPTEKTVIEFRERPSNAPVALRAWFYPGGNFGQEFVYPKARALELAWQSHEVVPAETAEATESNLKTVPLVAVTPEKKEVPITQAFEVTPPPAEAELVASQTPAVKELPKTASPIPLIALIGVISLGLGFGLKLVAKQLS